MTSSAGRLQASGATLLATAARERPMLLLGLWTCLLLAIHAPHQSFMAHDEGVYAHQARVILESGDWITQHWWGELWYDRAMGVQWLIAASYALFGYGELAARLPSMLACLGTVLLTYAIGTRFTSRETALLGAAILTATPIWMQASKLATQDVPLVFFELLGIWALLRAEEAGARRFLWGALAGAALGLGFFVKGFMVVPAAVAVLPYLLWEHRRHRHLANPGLYAGLAVSLLPTAAWFALSIAMHGWVTMESYFGKLLFLAQEDFHREGPLYYFWNVPANAFPWAFLALYGAAVAWRSDRFGRKTLFIGFPLLLFVELSFFTTRTWYYALQLLPFLALLAASGLAALGQRYGEGRGSLPTVLSFCLAGLGALLVIAAGVVNMRPDWVAPVPAWALGALGVLAGIGFCLPLAALLADRGRERLQARWTLCWLAGPWLAIASFYATGLWGDYGAGIKDATRTGEMHATLAANEVHFLFSPGTPGSVSPEAVLMANYTPNLGGAFADAAELPADAYAWVHDTAAETLAHPYREVGRAGTWRLVRLGEEPAAAPPG